MAKPARLRPGVLVEIDLGADDGVAVGRVLRPPLVEFYDRRLASADEVDAATLAKGPVAFRLWVMDRAVRSARWPVIGDIPLSPEEEAAERWFFRQDAITGDLFRYRSDPDQRLGRIEVPATIDQCSGLERAAVWDPEHVEDRLRDHFAGRPCKWVRPLLP